MPQALVLVLVGVKVLVKLVHCPKDGQILKENLEYQRVLIWKLLLLLLSAVLIF